MCADLCVTTDVPALVGIKNAKKHAWCGSEHELPATKASQPYLVAVDVGSVHRHGCLASREPRAAYEIMLEYACQCELVLSFDKTQDIQRHFETPSKIAGVCCWCGFVPSRLGCPSLMHPLIHSPSMYI